jgi:hypothetical protein
MHAAKLCFSQMIFLVMYVAKISLFI